MTIATSCIESECKSDHNGLFTPRFNHPILATLATRSTGASKQNVDLTNSQLYVLSSRCHRLPSSSLPTMHFLLLATAHRSILKSTTVVQIPTFSFYDYRSSPTTLLCGSPLCFVSWGFIISFKDHRKIHLTGGKPLSQSRTPAGLFELHSSGQ